jgi:ribonuclease E
VAVTPAASGAKPRRRRAASRPAGPPVGGGDGATGNGAGHEAPTADTDAAGVGAGQG